MNRTLLYKLTGLLLIGVTVAFNGFFTLLAMNFEYPDILRSPTGYVLEQYHAGGSGLTAQWYGMVVVSLLLIPLAVLVYHILSEEKHPALVMGTVFGIIAGLTNVLGFIRWIFVVPHLAEVYIDPASSQATREAVVVVFEAFHLYAGFSIGEHLGFIFIGLWSLLMGLTMLNSVIFKAWVGWLGIIAAPLIIIGSAEGAGLARAADINVIGFAVWSLWLIVMGVVLLWSKGKSEAPSKLAGAQTLL